LTAVDNEMKSKDFVIMSNKGSDEKDTIDQMVKNGVSPENKKILEDLGCYSHVTNTSVLEDMGNYSDQLAEEFEKSEENRDQSKINQLREKLKATTIELFGYTEEEIEKAKNEVEKAKEVEKE
jgi:Holliday junction resolvasome RuvABC DNA-binding subunit